MATIIQNLACFEIKIDSRNKRVYFNDDLLKGKKINQIWFYFGSKFNEIYSPLSVDSSYNTLLDITDVNSIGLFTTIVEPNAKIAVKELYIKNSIRTVREHYLKGADEKFIEYDINRIIDTEKTYLTVYSDLSGLQNLLVFVSYQNQPIQMDNAIITGSKTIEILNNGNGISDYKLSDYVRNTLSGKKIKKIIIDTKDTGQTISYLYIKHKNGLIENIPTSILTNTTNKELFFDNIEIDFENSFLKNRAFDSMTKEVITFIY